MRAAQRAAADGPDRVRWSGNREARHCGYGVPPTSGRFGVTFGQPFFFPSAFTIGSFSLRVPWWWYGYAWRYYHGVYSYPLSWDSYTSRDSENAFYEQLAKWRTPLRKQRRNLSRISRTHWSSAISTSRKSRTMRNVGQTLWIFEEQRARRALLSSLDVDGTTKLNEQRRVEFSLPKKYSCSRPPCPSPAREQREIPSRALQAASLWMRVRRRG